MTRYVSIEDLSPRIAVTAEKALEARRMAVLQGTEFVGNAFAVGGYVRDEAMGIASKDLDVVVGYEGGAEDLANYLHEQFPGKMSAPKEVGKGYPIWFVSFKGDVSHDGKVYRTEGAQLDIADSHTETFPDPTTRQRDIQPGTIEQDVMRRDFTVNMLMKDLATGEIVDMAGVSMLDIEEGVLRLHPAVDPAQPFNQDPLRMLRLIRFMVKYDFEPDADAVQAVRDNAHRIEIVSGERVQGELGKIMELGQTETAVRFLRDTGLLQYVMPEIHALIGVEQPEQFHSEGDVFEHTMLVLRNAPATVRGQLAALLHDAGKPSTYELIEDRIRFKGHEDVSAEIAEAFLRRLRYDKETIRDVTTLVRNHMRPHQAPTWGAKGTRRFMRDIGELLEDAIALAEADSLGSQGPGGEPTKNTDVFRQKIKKVQEQPVVVKPPLDGRDVMRILGVSQGADVGRAMRWLQDRSDELAGDGVVLDATEAERLLRDEY